VFNEEGKASLTPPFAARIAAKRGAGGIIQLYDADGRVTKEIDAK